MAELGVIASGMGVASLAMQIGESIMKLKNFMNAVKEAPADIRDMVEHIEALSVILAEFSDDEDPQPSPSTTKCLNLCRKSADTIQSIVRDLESEIRQRRFRGGVKFVLKEGMLNKLKARLTTAQDMLILSHSLAIKRQQETKFKALLFAVNEMKSSLPSNPTYRLQQRPFGVEGEVQESTIRLKTRSATLGTTNTVEKASKAYNTLKSKNKLLRINTASLSWLTKRTWEVCCYQAYSGWNITIRTYNIIPEDSLVFDLAIYGDVAGLQEMFKTGKASVYDVNSNGFTLLDLAAYNYHLDACRMLLEEGADPNISSRRSVIALAATEDYVSIEQQRRAEVVYFDLIRSLTTKIDHDFFYEESSLCYYDDFGIPTDTFEWLFHQSNPSYTPRSVSECWRIALEIASNDYHANSVSLIRVALRGWDIEPTICNTKDRFGRSLIWNAAYYLGEHHSILSRIHNGRVGDTRSSRTEDIKIDFEISDHPYPQSSYAELLSLIKDLLIGESKLHKESADANTAFLGLLGGFFEGEQYNYRVPEIFPGLQHEPRPQDAVAPMRVWLAQLQEVGIDLVEYGRAEHCLHIWELVPKMWYCNKFGSSWLDKDMEKVTPMRLISFTYGPSPSDWNLWITEAANSYAADFWLMIEHPERAMPGAWDEEEEEDECYYSYDEEMYDEDDNFIYPYISATDYEYDVTDYEQGMGFNIPFEVDESSSPTT